MLEKRFFSSFFHYFEENDQYWIESSPVITGELKTWVPGRVSGFQKMKKNLCLSLQIWLDFITEMFTVLKDLIFIVFSSVYFTKLNDFKENIIPFFKFSSLLIHRTKCTFEIRCCIYLFTRASEHSKVEIKQPITQSIYHKRRRPFK